MHGIAPTVRAKLGILLPSFLFLETSSGAPATSGIAPLSFVAKFFVS
jgi:hypothetical protein